MVVSWCCGVGTILATSLGGAVTSPVMVGTTPVVVVQCGDHSGDHSWGCRDQSGDGGDHSGWWQQFYVDLC